MREKARLRPAWTRLVLAPVNFFAVPALLGTLIALLAGSLWPLSLAASFHPQYAAVLVVAAGVNLLLRSRAFGVVLLVAAVVNGSLVAPYLIGAGGAADGPRLSVMSFNVGVSNPARTDVARYVADEQPDVLVIIESSFEWEDALEAAGPPMSAVAIVPRGRVSGMTVLADPGVRPRAITLDWADPGEAVALEVDVVGERLVVLALHPPSPTTRDRALRNDALLEAAGDWVAAVEAPVLVVGDFNATPWADAYRDLQLRAGLADTARGSGLQPSWPSGLGPLMIQIDNALHTAGLDTVERRLGPAFGSAHRSLHVTVAVTG